MRLSAAWPAAWKEAWSRLRAWRPAEDRRRKLKIAAFAAYTLAAAALFTWIQLPWKAISGLVTSQIGAWTGKNVSAEDVGLYGVSGIEFEKLRIERTLAPAVEIPELAVRLEILPLLMGRKNISGYVVLGGKSRFRARQSSGVVALDAAFAQMDLSALFPQGNPADFGVSGILDGTLSFKAPSTQLTAASFNPAAGEGALELTLAKGLLKGFNAGGFPVPPLHFDDWRVTLRIKDGRLDVKKFDLQGPDADVSIDGQVSLLAPLANSRLNLKLKLTPKGEFSRGYGGILSTQMRPEAGGSMGAYLQGTLGAPQIRQ